MTHTTKTMNTRETVEWLKSFFIGSRDWQCIYTDVLTAVYCWNLDDNVEVITTIQVDTVLVTVNFYKDACSGTPYRTGTVTTDDI